MVKSSRILFFCANYDFLVCPLSKQPLRHCKESQTLISDAIGVHFPIANGVPLLSPKDGKVLVDQVESKGKNGVDEVVKN